MLFPSGKYIKINGVQHKMKWKDTFLGYTRKKTETSTWMTKLCCFYARVLEQVNERFSSVQSARSHAETQHKEDS